MPPTVDNGLQPGVLLDGISPLLADDSTATGKDMGCCRRCKPGLETGQPLRFGVSGFFSQPIWILLNLFLAGYQTAWLAYSIYDTNPAKMWTIYLTYWTYTVETLFFWWATFTAISAWRTLRSVDNRDSGQKMIQNSRTRDLHWWYKLQWVWFYIACDGALVVTLIYWAFIFDGDTSAVNIHVHALNSIFILLYNFCSGINFRLSHVYIIYIYGTIYLTFNLIYWGAGSQKGDDNIIYDILNWNTGLTEAIIVVVAIYVIILPGFHLLQWAVCKLGVRMQKACGCSDSGLAVIRKNSLVELVPPVGDARRGSNASNGRHAVTGTGAYNV